MVNQLENKCDSKVAKSENPNEENFDKNMANCFETIFSECKSPERIFIEDVNLMSLSDRSSKNTSFTKEKNDFAVTSHLNKEYLNNKQETNFFNLTKQINQTLTTECNSNMTYSNENPTSLLDLKLNGLKSCKHTSLKIFSCIRK